MNEVLVKLKAIPGKMVDVINSLLNGLSTQVSTSKGAVLLLIGAVVIFDILLKGTMGVIGFTVEQVKIILLAVSEVMKTGGWQMIILILILVMMKDKKA